MNCERKRAVQGHAPTAPLTELPPHIFQRTCKQRHAPLRVELASGPGQSKEALGAIDLDPVRFARERLGFDPDAKQAEVLASTAKRGILNCARQWGKSTVTAAKAVHRAYSRPNTEILVVSSGGRQAGEFIRKAERFTAMLGIRPKGDGHNPLSICYPNRSRIIGLPSSEGFLRGFSAVDLLIIDEAAKVPDPLYLELRPMLATTNGDIWLMSTPLGKRGFFYREWSGPGKWQRISVPATECSRISAEFLAEERIVHTGPSFRQEYLCEFIDNVDCVFSRELIESVISRDIKPLFPK